MEKQQGHFEKKIKELYDRQVKDGLLRKGLEDKIANDEE